MTETRPVSVKQLTQKAFTVGSAELSFLNFLVDRPDFEKRLVERLADCDSAVGLDTVVRQVFFISPDTDREAVERAVAGAYGSAAPVTSYVYEPPADGSPLAAELWAFPKGAAVTQNGRSAVAANGQLRWGFVGGLETREDEGPYDGISLRLRKADDELKKAGFEFHDIIRTWYYIGDLLGPADSGSRYDRFNQARNEFFQNIWQDLRYSPASTGIGMLTKRVSMEGIVLQGADGSFKVTWVDNPLQTKPFVYDIGVDQKRKPSFSRAAAVTLSDAMIIFVAGTASIRKSEVICQEDAESQTRVTVDNINVLLGADNLVRNYGLPRGAAVQDFQQFRVYVKRPRDLDAVKRVCREMLPDVPHVCLIADVCRAQCLVEIEAVAAVPL